LTFFEAHHDDHEIANFNEDEEERRAGEGGEEEGGRRLVNKRREDEGEVLDWRGTAEGGERETGKDDSKELPVMRSTSIIPMTKMRNSQETEPVPGGVPWRGQEEGEGEGEESDDDDEKSESSMN
jgi:hypothetical protein